MGEASRLKRQRLSEREQVLAAENRCIFCGGETPATTIEHTPPRGMFVNRHAPQGYGFAACRACNAGSSDADEWVILLTAMDPTMTRNRPGYQALLKTARSLQGRHPDQFAILIGTASSRRRAAQAAGLLPPIGQARGELPIATMPPLMISSVKEFGRKLAKALHYKHTGRIVPASAAVHVQFFTNISAIRRPFSSEMFDALDGRPHVSRARIALGDQFNYRYACSDAGDLSAYICTFRKAFLLVLYVTFDPAILAEVKAAVRQMESPPAYAPAAQATEDWAWFDQPL